MAEKTRLGSEEVVNLLMNSPVTVCEWMQKGMLHAEVGNGKEFHPFSMDDVAKITRDYGLQFNRHDHGHMRILIVDDNVRTAHRLVELLDTLTETAESMPVYSAEDAADKIPGFLPDMVLVDLDSCYQDTLEMCRQIKSKHSTQHVRIIALCNPDDLDYKQRMLMAGVDLVLDRPIKNEQLLEIMGLHLDPVSDASRYFGISNINEGSKAYQS